MGTRQNEAAKIFDTTLRGGEESPGGAAAILCATSGRVNALNRLLLKREKQMPEALAVAR